MRKLYQSKEWLKEQYDDLELTQGEIAKKAGCCRKTICTYMAEFGIETRSRLIDETGNRYGKLTVIKRATYEESSVAWFCKCDCGNTTTVLASHLRSGHTKSCGCMRTVDVHVGERYGRLTAIKQLEPGPRGHIKWLCKCDCGQKTIVRSSSLKDANTRSCGCLRVDISGSSNKLPSGIAACNMVEHAYRQGARTRGLAWNLSREQFRSITQENCYYCGVQPSSTRSNSTLNGDYVYNGIDRVDSNKGYTPENVVPCCTTCNYAKRDMSTEQFLEWAERLAKHQGW